MAFNPKITQAGLAAFYNAESTGVQLELTHVAFGTGLYDPTGAETALMTEVKRVGIGSGSRMTETQIRIAAIWMSSTEVASVGEVGFYAGDVLFAVLSRASGGPLVYKTAGSNLIFSYDWTITAVDAAQISVTVDPDSMALLVHLADQNAHPQYLTIAEYNRRDQKNSVRVATTANITLSGLQTVDGIALAAGDRVLVKNQATAKNNGIYVAGTGTWVRSEDADANLEVTPGMLVPVEQGMANADSIWQLATDGDIIVGSTSLTFEIAAGPSGIGVGTYRSVTVDKRGRVTGGSNPTTIAGYGLTDAQPLDATLTALATLTTSANQMIYSTGLNGFAMTPLSAFMRTLLDDIDDATARATLGAHDASNLIAGTIPVERVPTLNQNTTGNAATATKLQTPRTINGESFDGSVNITIRAQVSAQAIQANTDLNTLTSENAYYCPSNSVTATLLNCPTPNAFTLLVSRHAGVRQELSEYVPTGAKTWYRNYYSGTWGSWYRIYSENDPQPYATDTEKLPLTGGELRSASAEILSLKRTSSSANATMSFSHTGGKTFLGLTSTNELAVSSDANVEGGAKLLLSSGGALFGKLANGGIDAAAGLYGNYSSAWNGRVQNIWSMGSAYSVAADGTGFGNLYGLAWRGSSGPGIGTGNQGNRQAVWCSNGVPTASFGDGGFWTTGSVYAAGGIQTGNAIDLPNSARINGTTNGLEISNSSFGTVQIGNRNTGYTHYYSSTGNHYFYGNIHLQSNLTVGGTIAGNGSGLNSLNASSLSTGEVPIERLPTAVRNLNQGSTSQDPNLAVDPVILTNHANSPGQGFYWHITTTFYSVISATSNRAQVAISYNSPTPQMWARSCYGNVWHPWVRCDLGGVSVPANTASLGATGWWKDGDTGLITQWGLTNSVGGNSYIDVTFPMTFPTECFGVQATLLGASTNIPDKDAFAGTPSTTGVRLFNNGSNSSNRIYWEAKGR